MACFACDCASTGQFLYEITTISSYDDGTVAEVTRRISAKDYTTIQQERGDKSRCKVTQRRVSFLWERQAFELQTDVEPAYGTSVLYRRAEVRGRALGKHRGVL